MKRISDVVFEIITNHPMLNFGMHHRLLNLSQVARFIHSAVEAQTEKNVRESAILMSLSRLQSKLIEDRPASKLMLDKINIHSGLSFFAVPKTQSAQKELTQLIARIHERGGFITTTQGLNEITTFLDSKQTDLVEETLSEAPTSVNSDIASLEITFLEPVLDIPGTVYQLLEQVALHNINLIGLNTNSSEINMYLKEKDVSTAYNAVYRRFSKQESEGGKK